jgi:hypothetical protein
LADDAELLNRALRERGAAAVVLTSHAAVVDQGLSVLTVDEDVDGLSRLTTGRNGPLRIVFANTDVTP